MLQTKNDFVFCPGQPDQTQTIRESYPASASPEANKDLRIRVDIENSGVPTKAGKYWPAHVPLRRLKDRVDWGQLAESRGPRNTLLVHLHATFSKHEQWSNCLNFAFPKSNTLHGTQPQIALPHNPKRILTTMEQHTNALQMVVTNMFSAFHLYYITRALPCKLNLVALAASCLMLARNTKAVSRSRAISKQTVLLRDRMRGILFFRICGENDHGLRAFNAQRLTNNEHIEYTQ